MGIKGYVRFNIITYNIESNQLRLVLCLLADIVSVINRQSYGSTPKFRKLPGLHTYMGAIQICLGGMLRYHCSLKLTFNVNISYSGKLEIQDSGCTVALGSLPLKLPQKTFALSSREVDNTFSCVKCLRLNCKTISMQN